MEATEKTFYDTLKTLVTNKVTNDQVKQKVFLSLRQGKQNYNTILRLMHLDSENLTQEDRQTLQSNVATELQRVKILKQQIKETLPNVSIDAFEQSLLQIQTSFKGPGKRPKPSGGKSDRGKFSPPKLPGLRF